MFSKLLETCADCVKSLQHVDASRFAGLRFLVGIACSNRCSVVAGPQEPQGFSYLNDCWLNREPPDLWVDLC